MRCYLFDIDGTLANNEHRAHHLKKEPKDWAAFFAGCHLDPPHRHIVQLARTLQAMSEIVFVTGRSEDERAATEPWLERQGLWVGLRPPPLRRGERLYMRAAGDHRPDTVVKMELLQMLRNDGWVPIMAFDDRNSVVEAWRAAGVPCAQVAPGDF